MFYQDLINYFFIWWRKRRWVRIFLLAALPTLLVLAALGLVIYGAMLGRVELTNRYLALVQSDVEKGLQEVASDSNELSACEPRVLVPLRRIWQLEARPEPVVYLMGMTLVQQGRSSMAAQLLRSIAPTSGGGYPAAHKFLADYNLAKWQGTDSQAQSLLADLQTAEQGGMELTVEQLSDCAALLVKFNRRQAAVDMLRRHSDEHPELNVQVVQLEKWEHAPGEGEQGDSSSALAAGRADFERKRAAGTATIQDVMRVVQLEMLDKQIDRALELARYGYQIDPDHADARRQFSNVLLAKHQWLTERWIAEVAEATKQGIKPPTFDIRYLGLASKIDSTNPQVSEELAKAMDVGQQLKPEMIRALERSLNIGTATSLAHSLQAKRKLADDEPNEVLQQLRLALSKQPDSAMEMNNLAYAILKFEPENIPEAKQLIERALNTPGVPLAGLASMLDTQAEIVLYEGNDLKAIELFEQAIELDSGNLDTRQKLAELYKKVGMSDLAQAQLARINELSKLRPVEIE